MSSYIKLIRTSDGSNRQIDYTALANLPKINNKQIIENVSLTASDINISANSTETVKGKIESLESQIGNIENGLDNIITIQNEIIGGGTV